VRDQESYVPDQAKIASKNSPLPSIECMAIHPDGRRLAIGRGNGVKNGVEGVIIDRGVGGGPVRQLDLDGRAIWTAFSHRNGVSCLAWSPDGRLILSGSLNEGIIKILDASTGKEITSLKAHESLCSVRFSPDGRWIATCGFNDRLAKLWDAATFREIHILQHHFGPVQALAFSPDSQRLATGGWDGRIEIWDVITGQNLLSLKAHNGIIGALAFSPDCHRLASMGRNDHSLKIWDARPLDPLTIRGPGPPRATLALKVKYLIISQPPNRRTNHVVRRNDQQAQRITISFRDEQW
jgi:WD40 repeat protein